MWWAIVVEWVVDGDVVMMVLAVMKVVGSGRQLVRLKDWCSTCFLD